MRDEFTICQRCAKKQLRGLPHTCAASPLVHRLETRIAELESWRPMTSAPLDGTTVLLRVNDSEFPLTDDSIAVTIGAYGVEGGPESDPTWSFCGWDWQFDEYRRGDGEPTGWLPLPAIAREEMPDG